MDLLESCFLSLKTLFMSFTFCWFCFFFKILRQKTAVPWMLIMVNDISSSFWSSPYFVFDGGKSYWQQQLIWLFLLNFCFFPFFFLSGVGKINVTLFEVSIRMVRMAPPWSIGTILNKELRQKFSWLSNIMCSLFIL